MVDIRKLMGKNIRYYRIEKRMSQEKLAELADLGPKSLSPVENGHNFLSPDKIERICEVLEVEPYKLFINDVKKAYLRIELTNPDDLDLIKEAIKNINNNEV